MEEENSGKLDDEIHVIFGSSMLMSDSLNGESGKTVQDNDDDDDNNSPVVKVEKEKEGGVCGAANGGGEAVMASGTKTGVSIAERRAAKCGFNASRINAARFKATSPLPSPSPRSPFVTIPPGISPTALLDSPVMLPISQGQPSPTTGTFTGPPFSYESLMLDPLNPATDGDRNGAVSPNSFSFKAYEDPNSLTSISGLLNPGSMDFQFPLQFPKEAAVTNCAVDSSAEIGVAKNMIINVDSLSLRSCLADRAANQTSQHRETIKRENSDANNSPDADLKDTYPNSLALGNSRTAEDGYNWRKYGQKQVKGSEYPRSYYKCTHPNCQVKKKVERCRDGQITEIIYKGAHNHPKPQPNRRSLIGSSLSFGDMSEIGEGNGPYVNVEGGAVWRNMRLCCKDIKVGPDWRADGQERTSSTSVVTENSDTLSNSQAKSMGPFDSDGTPELSSTLASHDDDDEDRATQFSISAGEDAGDDECEPKRRKKDSCITEANVPSRSMREPRVIVQIESEVDILDDGYRWRKYGQKVVKGNPNPRSYYKCTSAGCLVRKHVERASNNLRCVITTYEGKHNHEVPAAKDSTQVNPGMPMSSIAPNTYPSSLSLPINANIPKPETEAQDLAPPFERKLALGGEFMRPSFGNFTSDQDMKFAPSPIYQMKFPPIPYGAFLMNPNHKESHPIPTCAVSPVLRDFPLSLPMSLQGPAKAALASSFDFNSHEKPISSIPPFICGQQLKDNGLRFLKPKQEKEDNSYETRLPIANNHNQHQDTAIQMHESVNLDTG